MTLKFKTEADYQKWLATTPKVRIAASNGTNVLANTDAGQAVATAPKTTARRLPSRTAFHVGGGWCCLALMYLGLVGAWTCGFTLWLLQSGFACDLI